MSTATRTHSRRRIASLALVPVAALVLGACGPTPAPAPKAASPTLTANATIDGHGRRTWHEGTKQYPSSTNCTGSYSTAVETCHLTYRFYNLDTTSPSAQNKINGFAISHMTHDDCSLRLNSFHSDTPGNQTGVMPSLSQQYPGQSPLGENLFCSYFGNENLCAGSQLGATQAIDGWLHSVSHKQTMDQFAGMWVNAAAVCIPSSQGGHGVYVAVAQFHP